MSTQVDLVDPCLCGICSVVPTPCLARRDASTGVETGHRNTRPSLGSVESPRPQPMILGHYVHISYHSPKAGTDICSSSRIRLHTGMKATRYVPHYRIPDDRRSKSRCCQSTHRSTSMTALAVGRYGGGVCVHGGAAMNDTVLHFAGRDPGSL